jgi:septation ring formation regulator EzrA
MNANAGGPRRVEQKLDALSASVDQRFEAIDQRFDAVDQRFEAIDQRFEAIDQRFDAVDKQFEAVAAAIVEQRQYTEFAFGRMDTRLERIERTLHQFIDTQTKTNDLVERRLQRLESR